MLTRLFLAQSVSEMVNTAVAAVGRDFGRAEAMHRLHVGRGHRTGDSGDAASAAGRGGEEELEFGHDAGVAKRAARAQDLERAAR